MRIRRSVCWQFRAVLVLFAVVLFVGARSAWAISPEQMAKGDFAAFEALNQQEEQLVAASVAVEDYAAGRLSVREAQSKLRACQQKSKSAKQKVYSSAVVGEQWYVAAVRDVANSRDSMIAHAASLLGHGDVSRSRLQEFQVSEGALAASSAEKLVKTRARLAELITKQSTNKKLSEYYIWYSDLSVFQLREVRLSLRMRQAMNNMASQRKANVSGLKSEADSIVRGINGLDRKIGQKAKKLLGKLSHNSKSSSNSAIAEANAAAVKEAKSLAHLAEAVELLAQDNSADSVSRFNRHSEAVRADSLYAARKSLGALERALLKY